MLFSRFAIFLTSDDIILDKKKGTGKMKKIITLLLCVLMIVSLLTGCGGSTETPAADSSAELPSYTIKFAHVAADGASAAIAAENFKSKIEEKSGGRIKVEIYGNSTLGSERELTEMIQAGSLEMADLGPCSMGNVVWPQLNVLEAPFLFHSTEEALRAMDSEYADQLVKDIYDNTNCYILGWNYRGARHLFTREPCYTPEDIKGLKIRVPTVDVYVDTFNALGCNVTPIAYNELYSSLQTGVVDGFEGAYDMTYSMGFQEVTKYCNPIGWINYFGPIVIAKSFYESLTPEDQALFEEVMEEVSAENTQFLLDSEADFIEKFEAEGVEIYDPNIEEWAAVFTDEVIADMAYCWGSEGSTEIYRAWQAAARGE